MDAFASPARSRSEPGADAFADETWPAAVQVRRAATLVSPVIFASPHSGRFYPPALLAASCLDAQEIRLSEDAFVDELIAPVAALGAALVLAGHARAWVDLNRAADELDAGMFDTPPQGAAPVRSARVAAGLGSIPRVVGAGRPIYRDKLPAEEAGRRLQRSWEPYHQTLSALVDEARGQFGRAVLLDWHSMPSAAAAAAPGRAPDVVLGDRYGGSCSGALTALVQRELEAMGYRVARNAPYAGGWTTERYGRPAEGVHALQIELNRRLYLDEPTAERTAGFPRLQRDVALLARTLTQAAGSERRKKKAAPKRGPKS